ncbi:hypothetical protein BBJ28_00011266 [Nothophytophthora sp. Chile5]|nr:hypothetical protein BBJ28_00011266 [Nothophytophthora sp. Chile5]
MPPPDIQVQQLGRDALDAAALARLSAVVSRSAFVAIDTEMGGVSCQDSPRPSVMDSVDERYAQYRESARQFPLVQFGLSAFTWHASTRSFHVETFQFPLFPVFHDKLGPGFSGNGSTAASACPDRRFLLQAKCLQYIRAHGFDLNAWVDEGIGHLSHAEQQQEPCRSALTRSARPEILRKFDPQQPTLITDETQTFLDQLAAKLRQRLAVFDEKAASSSASAALENGTRRRGRRGGKKNKKKNNGRSRRRGGDSRDRFTPTSSFSGKEEPAPVAAGGLDAEEQQTGAKQDDADEDEDEESGRQEPEREAASQEQEQEPDDETVASMKRFLQSPVSADGGSSEPCGAFVTEPLAPFRRHALVQYLHKLLPETLALDCKADNAGDEDVERNPWRRRVRIVSPRYRSQRQALLLADEQLEADEKRQRNLGLVGFTAVLDVLVAARKPLVGHNMLLDLMQCFEKFHGPLPATCAAFQRELHTWLGSDGGGVFDTKTLVDRAMQQVDTFATHLTHTALSNCFDVLAKHPFYGPEVHNAAQSGGGSSQPSDLAPLQAHQAGYDAFMTGFVFLRVCSGLGVSNEALATLGQAGDESLEKLRNVLFVSHFLPTFLLSLPGPYPEATATPSRSRFVRMALTRTRPPTPTPTLPGCGSSGPTLKTFHIKHCVGWALDLQAAARLVNVHWEGAHCVYVELPTTDAAAKLLALRGQLEDCWATTSDPMPSLGCVDLEACGEAQAGAMATPDAAPPPPGSEEETRRKRKSSEME